MQFFIHISLDIIKSENVYFNLKQLSFFMRLMYKNLALLFNNIAVFMDNVSNNYYTTRYILLDIVSSCTERLFFI